MVFKVLFDALLPVRLFCSTTILIVSPMVLGFSNPNVYRATEMLSLLFFEYNIF